MTQKETILKALKRGWLTAMECTYQCGTTKLTSRVSDYRRQGYKIIDKTLSTSKGVTFKAYRLVK